MFRRKKSTSLKAAIFQVIAAGEKTELVSRNKNRRSDNLETMGEMNFDSDGLDVQKIVDIFSFKRKKKFRQ